MISLRGTVIAAALLAAACGRGDAPGSDASPGRFPGAPVILISVDTLRADRLPAYGYRQVETPNIDGLRRDSVLFERVYSHCPMTLPSHASMFTGSLPTEHGVRNNIGYRFEGAKLRTLAEELRERGYAAGAAVSSYVLRSDTGIDDGFEFYEDSIAVATAGATSEHQRPGGETLKHAQAWILEHREQPFFFFLHLYEPHAPYDPPEPFKSRYPDAYDGEVAAADAIVGELIRSLKASGLYDRAIIIFTSDHGEGLWDHGEDQHGILLYREALWVPLLVKLPGSHQAGSISRDSISRPMPLAHLFGTVLRLVGIDLPSRPASWFDAEAGGEARPIYSETLYPRIHLGWSELRSLIDGRYHYIEGPSPELYDLERDPGEARNLITTERREASRLRREMQAYPATAETIGEIDPEDARNLAALGYVGSPRERGPGPLPNPRDEVKNLARIKAAFRFADERRLNEATAALRSLLQENPKLLDVWSKLGEVLVEAGRYDEAIEVYRSAIAHAERFSPDLALALGFAYLKHGETTAAATHARLALTTHPRETNELLARVALEEGRFDAAEEHARSALQSGDSQPATLLLLADVERTAGKLEQALRTVEEAERRAAELGIRRQGSLQGADYLRGDLLARLDRPEEAAAAYRREIEAFPQHLQAYANLAVILMIQGRSAEANELLEQMARSNPHRGAFLLAAKTLEAFEDRQGAARWRQRAAR